MSTTPLSYVAKSKLCTKSHYLSLHRSLRRLPMRIIQEHVLYINQLCTSQQTAKLFLNHQIYGIAVLVSLFFHRLIIDFHISHYHPQIFLANSFAKHCSCHVVWKFSTAFDLMRGSSNNFEEYADLISS